MMTDLRAIGFSEVRARIAGKRLEVYAELLTSGPSTACELAAQLDMDKTSVRPRLTELVQMFHAKPTGVRRNGEHEFIALSADEAAQLHAAATRPAVTAAPAEVSQPEFSLT